MAISKQKIKKLSERRQLSAKLNSSLAFSIYYLTRLNIMSHAGTVLPKSDDSKPIIIFEDYVPEKMELGSAVKISKNFNYDSGELVDIVIDATSEPHTLWSICDQGIYDELNKFENEEFDQRSLTVSILGLDTKYFCDAVDILENRITEILDLAVEYNPNFAILLQHDLIEKLTKEVESHNMEGAKQLRIKFYKEKFETYAEGFLNTDGSEKQVFDLVISSRPSTMFSKDALVFMDHTIGVDVDKSLRDYGTFLTFMNASIEDYSIAGKLHKNI